MQVFEEEQANPALHETVQVPEQSEAESCAEAEVAASTLYVPAGQLVHVLDPIKAAKVPAAHTKHWLNDVWADADPESSVKYVPTGQAVQVPVVAAYVPAGHTTHPEPLGE